MQKNQHLFYGMYPTGDHHLSLIRKGTVAIQILAGKDISTATNHYRAIGIKFVRAEAMAFPQLRAHMSSYRLNLLRP